jgi:predicted nucleic acid-binding protein
MSICWRRRSASVASEPTRGRSSARCRRWSVARRRAASSNSPDPACGRATCRRCGAMPLRPANTVASIVPASPDLLVDTSAWIEVFRRRPRITLERLAGDLDRVVTCLPVIQEVLQGFDDERAFRVAHEAMWSLPCVESPLTSTVVDAAVDLYRRARRAGFTVRSSVDCLVAVCASRHHLRVVHRDRDFLQLASVMSFEQEDISAWLV